ncbi:MAG: helix-turn-helix domain-containing protein [bacterium]
MIKLPPALQFLLLTFAGWVNRKQQRVIEYLLEENRVLREQLGGRRLRLTNDQRRRLAAKGKLLGRKLLGKVAGIVTPDTILRWYRTLIAKKYDGSKRRGPGRPSTPEDIAELVIMLAQSNPTWGYTRIRGAMRNLGHELGRSTIKRILKEAGIEPAPERGGKTPWKTFLKTHWGALAAADFFTVEVLTLGGLIRCHVLFVIELSTRRVEIAGITRQPTGEWMMQVGRNLTDVVDGFLRDKRFLILDRDPLFTNAFRHLLKESGVTPVRLPARSPDLMPLQNDSFSP